MVLVDAFPGMISARPTVPDEQFRADFLALMDKHTGKLPADRMLALASYTVGQLVAMQDQTRFTPQMAMAIVASNVEAGNLFVVNSLMKNTAGQA